MKTLKILLIGGPGTGKSSVLEALQNRGYTCFPEVSREVTLQAQQEGVSQLFLEEPLLFSERLLAGRIQQHEQATNSEEKWVFMDRGIPDVTAYMDYKSESYPKHFTEANNTYRYDQVFFFPIWNAIYESDNERYESLKEAIAIQEFIKNAYLQLNYDLIEVPKQSVQERVEFILKQLDR